MAEGRRNIGMEILRGVCEVKRGVARTFSMGLFRDGLQVTCLFSKDAGPFEYLTTPIVGAATASTSCH